MHKKGKQDCTIYTVLRLRRGLTRGQEAEKGKAYVASAINKAEAEHIPARRSNQGARARLDRESEPSKYKKATGRPEIYFISIISAGWQDNRLQRISILSQPTPSPPRSFWIVDSDKSESLRSLYEEYPADLKAARISIL